MDNDKNLVVKVKRLPYVGETVFSKVLKLERVVKSIGNNSITLEAKKPNVLSSLFELLSLDFDRTMSLSDFEVDYFLPENVKVQNPKFTEEDIDKTFAKLGDQYQHIETQEKVMMGLSHTSSTGDPLVELHSEDKMFNGEFISYLVNEDYFKSYFVNSENKRRRFRDLENSSVSPRTISLSF